MMKKIILSITTLFIILSCSGCCINHEYGDWVVCKDVTCQNEGEEIRICLNCGKQEKRVIPIDEENLNHQYKLIEEIEGTDRGSFKCELCGKEEEMELRHQDLGLPIMRIDGDFSLLTADKNSETMKFSYDDTRIGKIEGYVSIKLQGQSSIRHPKKNYTIKMYEDEELENKLKVNLIDSVGKQSKYCLKANWIDYSESRNVVSGQIYNQIVHSRDLDDEVSKLDNGGVVDGYPICLYENGEFWGIYTLNIPKDDFMFGMDEDDSNAPGTIKQAVLSGNSWNGYSKLYYPIKGELSEDGDIQIEYLSTEDTIGTEWAKDSFNNMINFINTHSGQSFKDGIKDYVNVERTIDALIYTYVISATDNLAKNINWATYDGTHWMASMYDMDGTWGLYWNGGQYGYDQMIVPQEETLNLLYRKIYANYKEEINQRYEELREDVLSDENIEKMFTDFYNKIPQTMWEKEKAKWPNVPSNNFDNLKQIINYSKNHLALMDRYY